VIYSKSDVGIDGRIILKYILKNRVRGSGLLMAMNMEVSFSEKYVCNN
jgi:hypothetical protein